MADEKKGIQVKVTGSRCAGALNAVDGKGNAVVIQHSVNMPTPKAGDTIEVVEMRNGDAVTGLAFHPQPKGPAK